MLIDLLWQTRVAGKPNSFFRPQSMAHFAQKWEVPEVSIDDFGHGYLTTAIERGTANTGCFGLRIMWDNLPPLLRRLRALLPEAGGDVDVLKAAFGPMRFIHLYRNDQVAEAVSLAMAAQTGLWHRHADGRELERSGPPREPSYDFDQILREYKEVTEGDAAWQAWFTAQGVTPLRVCYEDLVEDIEEQLSRLLTGLGCDPARAAGLRPGTARLATSLSRDWAARFRADAGLAMAASPK